MEDTAASCSTRTLAVYAEELDSNQAAKSPALRLAVMAPVAKAMARLAGRAAGSSPDLYATAPSDAVAKTLAEFADRGRAQQSEPLFQTTDILDISILDEDQDLLGLEKPPMSTTPQAPQLNASIFRAYDIRGVVGDSLTAEAGYWIGRAIGCAKTAPVQGQHELLRHCDVCARLACTALSCTVR